MQEIIKFLKHLLSGFGSLYFIGITSFITIVTYIYAPADVHLNPGYFAILTLLGVSLFLISGWLIYKGWLLYQIAHNNDSNNTKVIDFLRSDNYGGELVFLIESESSIPFGQIAELRRFHNDVEVSFALIEFMEKNSKGQYQAKHIWSSPGHFLDLKRKKFSISEINIKFNIHSNTLEKYKEE